MFFPELQDGITAVVYFVLLAIKLWALVDASLRPAQAYDAADKLTKTGWLWILGLTFLAHLLLGSFLLSILGTVAAFVYLLDVKPALAELTRRRR